MTTEHVHEWGPIKVNRMLWELSYRVVVWRECACEAVEYLAHDLTYPLTRNSPVCDHCHTPLYANDAAVALAIDRMKTAVESGHARTTTVRQDGGLIDYEQISV